MSGVAVVRYKLANSAGLTAIVPATRVLAGVLPQNTAVPCIAVTTISSNERRTLSMGEVARLVTERVQVTVYVAKDSGGYPMQKRLMGLIRAACTPTGGTINGVVCDSVLSDGDGPDFFDDVLGLHEQSQDFVVRFLR